MSVIFGTVGGIISFLISGEVRGPIDVKKQIRIYSTSKVLGDLNTPVFAVEEGAFFEGTCHMASSEAEVHTLPLKQTAAKDKGMRRSEWRGGNILTRSRYYGKIPAGELLRYCERDRRMGMDINRYEPNACRLIT